MDETFSGNESPLKKPISSTSSFFTTASRAITSPQNSAPSSTTGDRVFGDAQHGDQLLTPLVDSGFHLRARALRAASPADTPA
jgi:hypothetical protein